MAVGPAALQAARFWEIVRILLHRILRALRCDEPAWADPRRSHPSAVLLPPTRPLAPSQRSASATRASMDVIASVLRVWRAPTVKLTAVGMPPQQNIAPMLVYAILQERR